MTNKEENNSFDWVYYVLGLFFGILTAVSISGNFFWWVFGGIVGFVIAAIFLNGIVKGREY